MSRNFFVLAAYFVLLLASPSFHQYHRLPWKVNLRAFWIVFSSNAVCKLLWGSILMYIRRLPEPDTFSPTWLANRGLIFFLALWLLQKHLQRTGCADKQQNRLNPASEHFACSTRSNCSFWKAQHLCSVALQSYTAASKVCIESWWPRTAVWRTPTTLLQSAQTG